MKTKTAFNYRPTPHWRIDIEYDGIKDSIHIYTENYQLSEEQILTIAKALEEQHGKGV